MDDMDRVQELEAERIAKCIEEAKRKAAANAGIGQEFCEDCGDEIPMARRQAMPSAIRCVFCQSHVED